MRGPDAASVDWAGLLEEAIPAGPAGHLAVVRCVARAGVVEVTFRGVGAWAGELFGVRIPIPRAVGEAWWQGAVGPNPHVPNSTATPEDWARLMAISEVMAPYDMMNPTSPPEMDSDGVRWLFQIR
jgi:hypothetical protein